jgi:hypothetical protein
MEACVKRYMRAAAMLGLVLISSATINACSGDPGSGSVGDAVDPLKGGTPGSGKVKDKTTKHDEAGSGAIGGPSGAAGAADSGKGNGKGKGKIKDKSMMGMGKGSAAGGGDAAGDEADSDDQADEADKN